MKKESIGKLLLTLMTALVMVIGAFAAAVYTNSSSWAVAPGEPVAASELAEGTREIGDAPISALEQGTKSLEEAENLENMYPEYADVNPNMIEELKAEKEAAEALGDGIDPSQSKNSDISGGIEGGKTSPDLNPIATDPNTRKEIEIHGTRAAVPIADPNGPYTGDEGENIQFTGSATNGPILEWEWDFGDYGIGSSNAQNPVYAYGDNGDWTVRLRARNADGWGPWAETDATIYNVAPYNLNIQISKPAASPIVYHPDTNDGSAIWPPFQDAWGYPMRVQCLYFADQFDSRFLGKDIIDINLQLAYWRSSQTGTWQYVRLWIANTNLNQLATNLNTNYNRPLSERVANYPGPYTYEVNTGTGNPAWGPENNWHRIGLNEQYFQWDGSSNVIIDMEVGDQISGNDISTDGDYPSSVTTWVFGRSNNPTAYFSDTYQYSLRMGYVDTDPNFYEGDMVDIKGTYEDPALQITEPLPPLATALVETSNDGTAWWPPFANLWGTNARTQILYRPSQLWMWTMTPGVPIEGFALQRAYWHTGVPTVNNLEVRIAHTTRTSLGSSFNLNLPSMPANGALSSFTFDRLGPQSSSFGQDVNWGSIIPFNLNTFTWDGSSSIILDIQWTGWGGGSSCASDMGYNDGGYVSAAFNGNSKTTAQFRLDAPLSIKFLYPPIPPYGDWHEHTFSIHRYIGNPPSMPLTLDPMHPDYALEELVLPEPETSWRWPCYGDYLVQYKVEDDDDGIGIAQSWVTVLNRPCSVTVTGPADSTAAIQTWNLDPPANNLGWSIQEWGPYAWYHTQDWQHGMPGIGAASMPFAYGTRLTSTYTTYGLDHLLSPTFTVSTGAILEFAAAWQYESYYDGWQVCFYDGLSYTLLQPSGGSYPQVYTYAIAMHGWYNQGAFSLTSTGYPAYTPMSFDLSSVEGRTGRIVFVHCTDYSVNYNGLFVDDIRISAPLTYAVRDEGMPIDFGLTTSDAGACPLTTTQEYAVDPYTGDEYECIVPTLSPLTLAAHEEVSSGNYIPFWTAQGNAQRFQMLYNADYLGGLGIIDDFAWKPYWSGYSCTVGNFRIKMTSVERDTLSLTYADNYEGQTPTLVKNVPSFNFGGAADVWFYFDLDTSFNLQLGKNLLLEIQWRGLVGQNTPVQANYNEPNTPTRIFAGDDTQETANGGDWLVYPIQFVGASAQVSIFDDGFYETTATVSDGADLYGDRYGNNGFDSDAQEILIQNLPPGMDLAADPHMALEINEHREILHDDVEGGGNIAWTSTGLWHPINTAAWPSAPPPRAHSGTRSWYMGRNSYWNYAGVGTVQASLTTQPIVMEGSQWNLFEFYYWMEVQEGGTYYDVLEVILTVNGVDEYTLLLQGDSTSTWLHEAVYLDNYANPGDIVEVEFYFNSQDGIANNGEGVYVDDVKLTSFGFADDVYLTDFPIVFHALVNDPGSDDITLTMDFGPGIPMITETYYNYDMPGGSGAPSQAKPDPFPSPCQPASDMDLTEQYTICEGGDYELTVTAEDDDGGVTVANLVIPMMDAIKILDVDFSPKMHHVPYTLIDGGQDHDDGYATVLADVDDIGIRQLNYDDFSYFMFELGVAHVGGEGSPTLSLWEDALTFNFPTEDFVYEFLFSPGDMNYGDIGYFVVVIGVPSKGWSQELYDIWESNSGFLPFEYDLKFESTGPGVCGAHPARVQVDHVRDGEKHKWWEWEFRRSQLAMLAILELDWNIDMNVGPDTYDLTQIKQFNEYSARYYWLDWGTAVPKEAVLYLMVYLFTVYIYTDVDNMGVPQDPIVAIGHELGVQGALPIGDTDTRSYAGGTLVLDGPGRSEWHVGMAYMQLPSGNDLKIIILIITEEVTTYYYYALVSITKFGRPVAEYLIFGMGPDP